MKSTQICQLEVKQVCYIYPIEYYWAKKEKEGRTKTKGRYRNDNVEFQGTKNKKVEPNALE